MDRRTLLSSLTVMGTVAIAGCSNSSEPTPEPTEEEETEPEQETDTQAEFELEGASDPGEESRTTQTDVSVEEEGDTITYTLTTLDERTDEVIVRDGNQDTLYTFEAEGDTYTIDASMRHSVIALQNDREILLESVL